MREIMAGKWEFPCFGPARAYLSRSKRAPIAGGHNAGNTDAGGEAALACQVPEQPAVRTLRGRFRIRVISGHKGIAVRKPVIEQHLSVITCHPLKASTTIAQS